MDEQRIALCHQWSGITAFTNMTTPLAPGLARKVKKVCAASSLRLAMPCPHARPLLPSARAAREIWSRGLRCDALGSSRTAGHTQRLIEQPIGAACRSMRLQTVQHLSISLVQWHCSWGLRTVGLGVGIGRCRC